MSDYTIHPLSLRRVRLTDTFWLPRWETNRTVTIPHIFEMCERTGRIANFARAAGRADGPFEGRRYNDSDLFKVIEAAAYVLAQRPDPQLEAYLDRIVDVVAAVQEPDGYLYTARTVDPAHPAPGAGETRWSYLQQSHELYNVGHLYEAAVAYYYATGRRTLLNVALKNADLVARTFGPTARRDVPGHEEIELALVKLYRLTGERIYLDLARFFVDERGHAHGRQLYGSYAQDHRPVTEQTEAVGHAVRATYLYAAMTDLAVLTDDEALRRAVDRLWEDVVGTKLYLTGGIGARRDGEAFGEAYELPNLTAYGETCAAIGLMLWTYRLFRLHGDARYLDVIERTLYNGFLSGVSYEGDAFFYPNPLASDGHFAFNQGATTRRPWFDCACCPTNVARFMAALPRYVYATADAPPSLYVNLFIGSEAELTLADTLVRLTQTTRYPWAGEISLVFDPDRPVTFTLHLRLPGWVQGYPVPGELYRYTPSYPLPVALALNGQMLSPEVEKSFVRLHRTWRAGDRVTLSFPVPVRRVLAHPRVADDAGCVALERGPLVYCVEGADVPGDPFELVLPGDAPLIVEDRPDFLGGLLALKGIARTVHGAILPFAAIPYYAWGHRGPGSMTVWLWRGA